MRDESLEPSRINAIAFPLSVVLFSTMATTSCVLGRVESWLVSVLATCRWKTDTGSGIPSWESSVGRPKEELKNHTDCGVKEDDDDGEVDREKEQFHHKVSIVFNHCCHEIRCHELFRHRKESFRLVVVAIHALKHLNCG